MSLLHIQRLLLSAEVGKDDIRMSESFASEWPSPMSLSSTKVKLNTNANGENVYGAVVYEAAMVSGLRSRAAKLRA